MMEILDDEKVVSKFKIVVRILDGELNKSQAARHAGRSWNTINTWVKNYEKDGIFGLKNKPRGKSGSLDGDIRERIIWLKRKNRSRSSRKIRDLLKGYGLKVHRQTVWRVLKAAGENRRERKQLKPDKDYEYPGPNDAWHIDIMDGIVVKGVGMVYLHLIEDDNSREIMGGRFYTSREAKHVFKVMKIAFSKNGLPRHMIQDRGTQFRSTFGRGYSQYERILERLGINGIFITGGHPKSNGKIERLFGFIQDDFLSEYIFTGLDDLNEKFDEWCRWYSKNHEHGSLNGEAPGDRYSRVNKRFIEVDFDDVFCQYHQRKVRKNATVSFKKNVYPVPPGFIGEYVELRVFDGEVRIFREGRLLGTYDSSIDYREKMLRRVQGRIVRKDGNLKFQKELYFIGRDYTGEKVEVMKVRDQIRVFMKGNKQIIFNTTGEEIMNS
jgi:transposase InsO family protein